MGIYNDALLIFGRYMRDLDCTEAAQVGVDDGIICGASPYYDSPSSEWVVGFCVDPNDLINGTLGKKELQEYADELSEYGITDPVLIVAPNIT